MNKFRKQQNQNIFGMFNDDNERKNYNSGQIYPNMQFERLVYEIKENRRRINNLSKRITRIENYLRIRETTDYEDNPRDDYNF